MNANLATPATFRSQHGVTLIELMVSLVLGLLVTSGVIQIFIANRATYAFNEGLARLQENGRFSLDALNFNVRMAGYFGCLSGTTVFNNLNSSTTLPFNFAEGIRGYEGVGSSPANTVVPASKNPANSANTADWTPALPAALVGSAIPNSDVLVIRNVSAASHALLSPFVSATTVTANASAADYQRGDIGIVSDCQKASVFEVTNVLATGGGTPTIELSHSNAGTPGNLTASWGTDQEYSEGAQLMRGETWVYYIGARPGGGPPALFQRRLQADGATTTSALVADELVEHAETMQILYGVDPGLDGDVDTYVTANNVANWNEVVAVRIGLLMRSPDEYGTEVDSDTYDVNETLLNPVDDRRVRQVFTTTIALRNRLP
jgi:type IV pilus assembly protein PilW